ncbi:MAG: hypothetical protein IPK82_39625 [Polyangiaceae bacterium]|nr:hypothetical protein [Polyangiaceae bacterium]
MFFRAPNLQRTGAHRGKPLAQKAAKLVYASALTVFVAACSSEGRVVNIDITVGHETNAMTVSPPVENVVVKGVPCASCTADAIQAEAAPGGTLDFGEVDETAAYTFEVTGFDASNNPVLRGRSLGGIVLGQLASDTFSVFAQRLGGWSRPPGSIGRTHMEAPTVTVGERYLFLTGGNPGSDATQIEEYDLLSWAGIQGTETFPFAAQTLWSDISAVLALGAPNTDEAVQLDADGFFAPALPADLTSFGEVAGGSVVTSPNRVFIVGASRPDSPTDAVLDIDLTNENAVTVRRLNSPRAGATAAWLADVGLVVIGGSNTAPGVEVLAESAAKFAIRDFPPDPTVGAAATRGSVETLLLVMGGTNGGAPANTRAIDPRCTSACAGEDLPNLTLPVALRRTAAFFADTGKLIVVGDETEGDGLTRTFLLDDLKNTLVEMPLREPRKGASSVATPNGALALWGGSHPDGSPALTVEMFFPE